MEAAAATAGVHPDATPADRVDPTTSGHARPWVSQPEMSDAAVRTATGRGWDEWCDLIDAWPDHTGEHAATASLLEDQYGLEGWWAQSVTVGYERITGRRQRHERPDGTFTASKSRTVTVDAEALRELLLDDGGRADLFPGLATELRSRPTSKNVRIAMGSGSAEVSLEPTGDGRVKVTVQHDRLPSADDVDRWKRYWEAWLTAVDGG